MARGRLDPRRVAGEAPAYRGCSGRLSTSSTGRASPVRRHAGRRRLVAEPADHPMSCVHQRDRAVPPRRAHGRGSARSPPPSVVASSAVIGSSAISSFGLISRAPAIATHGAGRRTIGGDTGSAASRVGDGGRSCPAWRRRGRVSPTATGSAVDQNSTSWYRCYHQVQRVNWSCDAVVIYPRSAPLTLAERIGVPPSRAMQACPDARRQQRQQAPTRPRPAEPLSPIEAENAPALSASVMPRTAGTGAARRHR